MAKSVAVVRTGIGNDRHEASGSSVNGLAVRITGAAGAGIASSLTLHCVSFVGSYALNTIPTAQVVVACGVSVESLKKGEDAGTQQGELQAFLDNLTPGKEPTVEVMVKLEGDFDDVGTEWPPDAKLVFKGFISGGISYSVLSGRTTAAFTLRHILSKLTYSSALSALFSQGFPWDLASPLGGFSDYGAKQTPANLAEMIGHETSSEAIRDDVWGAIKNFLVEVCSQPILESSCLSDAAEELAGIQADGLEALRTIEGPADQTDYSREYKYGGPIEIGAAAAQIEKVATTIADFFARTQAQEFAGADLWTVLIGTYLPQLGLVLCPTGDGAVVAPDISSLQPITPWAVIPADEQFQPNIGKGEGRLIRGVLVVADSGSEYGVEMGGAPGENPKRLCVGGSYLKKELPGSVITAPPPIWLAGVQSSDGFTLSTTGLKSNIAVSTAVSPKQMPVAPDQPAQLIDNVRELFDAYARTVFVTERLRGRRGTLNGKLRFDIGPGSFVKIERENDVFSGGEASTTDFYAYVYQTTVAISADPPQASASFGLSNIRDAQEILNDDSWASDHPLYGEISQAGVPLVGEFPV